MRYKRKKQSKIKKYGVHFHDEQNGMCTGKKKYEKVNMYKIYRITKY